MKSKLCGRSWSLLVFVMLLLSGSLFADSSATLYPGWGTTLNGKAVYFSVLIATGYQIQTADEGSTITFDGAALEIAPNSILVVGTPFVLTCGTIIIRSGAADISDGSRVASFTDGDKVHAGPPHCYDPRYDPLPDAPSAVQRADFLRDAGQFKRSGGTPVAATGGLYINAGVMNWSYWTVNAAMLTSSLVSVDLTHKCLEADACTLLPDVFRRRRVMYGGGLPAIAAVSYLGYYLKNKHHSWWFVPAALITAGNVVISTHAAHYSH